MSDERVGEDLFQMNQQGFFVDNEGKLLVLNGFTSVKLSPVDAELAVRDTQLFAVETLGIIFGSRLVREQCHACRGGCDHE